MENNLNVVLKQIKLIAKVACFIHKILIVSYRAFFVIERTGTAFWHLFSTDFQSLNPMWDENWTFLI
jgi:hypothetical protein